MQAKLQMLLVSKGSLVTKVNINANIIKQQLTKTVPNRFTMKVRDIE